MLRFIACALAAWASIAALTLLAATASAQEPPNTDFLPPDAVLIEDVGVVTHWSRGRFDDLTVEDFVIR